MSVTANAQRDVRQNTKATASTVINTVPVQRYAISTRRNSITKNSATRTVARNEERINIEDDLKIKREHAYLIPNGNRLPFRDDGKVFYMENKEDKVKV